MQANLSIRKESKNKENYIFEKIERVAVEKN